MKKRLSAKLDSFVPFGAPKFSRKAEQQLIQVLRSGWIGAGPKVEEFEKAFVAYTGTPYAVAVSSCTAGLHASLVISNVRPDDEVITTPLTFIATANAILQTGARVRFVDIELDTFNMSTDNLQKAITNKTKAVVPVHFGGLPVDLDAMKKITKPRKIHIIEDAAHAIGARYNGRYIGNHGNLATFSFYPNKNITSGEGGMITVSNRHIVDSLRILRMHGLGASAWKRYHVRTLHVSLVSFPGYKYNLTDLQAVLGLDQLSHVEMWQKRREKYATLYDNEFRTLRGVNLQKRPTDIKRNRHSLHLYLLRLDRKHFQKGSRDKIVQSLMRKNIGAAVHYYPPLHLHPLFKSMGYRKGDFPIAEKVSEEIFTLPLTPHISINTIRSIANITKKILVKHSSS